MYGYAWMKAMYTSENLTIVIVTNGCGYMQGLFGYPTESPQLAGELN